mgnify:CR=1 FL=1
MQNLPIGEVLKEYGYITQEQIDQALQFQKTQSGKKVRFGTLLQEMGFVTETQVLEALGKKLDLQMVNLEEYEVNVDVVAKVPKQLAEKYNVIALSENDSRLQLAMSDPLNFYAQEDIRQIVDMPLEVLLSESPKIKKAIEYYYAEISTKQAAKKANISAEDIEVPQLTADDADDDVPIIKLINSVADVVNNDPAINGKIKVVFIENYDVSNAEIIFAAADVSEQISTASKEASGTGNMKFMLNGALTLGTMDGANVEIVEEVGKENAFIFGLSADQVIEYENNYTYDPMSYFIHDQDIHNVVMDLISGRYSNGDTMMFRDLYDSLLTPKNAPRPDMYFTLADFKSYAAAQERVEDKYRNTSAWARSAILNTAHSGKFTSDRTIQQYVDDIWHLDKITVRK